MSNVARAAPSRRQPARAAGSPARPPGRPPVAPNPVGTVTFPEALPVSARRDEIIRALQAHQVLVVSGETGSGKTTQLPKICLSIGRGLGAGGTGLIGHTQPRRIAASATARRIAEELNSPPGQIVGYKVRFNDTLGPGASVKLMTDGILLAETQGDPLLRAYDTLIIDEAHERSLNIDFLLGYLRQLLPRRPDLKLIVTSATIDAARFAEFFAQDGKPAPVIQVSGRMFPVEIRYRPVQAPGEAPRISAREGAQMAASPADATASAAAPPAAASKPVISYAPSPSNIATSKPAASTTQAGRAARERDMVDAIVDAVDELCRAGPGDVLVFLAGEREIRECAEALRKHHPPHTEILPLFARLSAAEQERVFKLSNARRVVLATNVAETSLTVPGIRYVVDTGLARVKRYSYRQKVEQLQIEPISQAAANQRAGRCGRVADGICIRLYEESDYQSRAAYTDPEILRASLAAVILRMKALRLADIEAFPFLEPPPKRAIADGYQLLMELGAIDDALALTEIGGQLARLPVDPRVGRMILAARDENALAEMVIIASALSVQDPRDRPIEAQEAADASHRQFADERSEFLSWLKLWQWYETALEQKKSNRQLTQLCRDNFLSSLRLREWRDVHTQILAVVREHGWRIGETPATVEQIHLSLLAGLLGNIGLKADDEPHYLGARGIKFFLWPGSTLVKKAGRWVVAAEMVETSRLFARGIGKVEPTWIERAGAHLLKKSVAEPHWERKAARVMAYERGTLYGLPVYQRRKVGFGEQDPALARELFIRHALVAGDFETRRPFLAHNRRLVADIEQLEHKSRRQDVLVDDGLIFAFYDHWLPAHIHTGAQFEKWYDAEAAGQARDQRLLFLSRDDLMRHEAAGITTDVFPKQLSMGGHEMPLSYHFEPGSPRDGVTLTLPLLALNQIDARRCEWLVPGMLKEKVQALLKSLPQKLRRHCVPLPDYAAAFAERSAGQLQGLVAALAADISTQTPATVRPEDFKLESLPPHLFMNFKVVDEHGRQLAMARSLAQLRAELGREAQQQFHNFAARVVLPAEPGMPLQASSAAPRSTDAAGPGQVPALRPGKTRGQERAHASTAAGAGKGKALATDAAVAPGAALLNTSGAMIYDNLQDWSFGELPELLEIRRDGRTFYGYPALVDCATHCEIRVFDTPADAARMHRAGLRRLLALQWRDIVKYLEKNLPGMQRMAMQYMPLGTLEELREQIIDRAIDRAGLQEPLPHDAASFAARREAGRERLSLLAQEAARLVARILDDYADVSKKLMQAKSFGAAYEDMRQQLAGLVGKRFVAQTPDQQLSHLPRYLQGIALRITKLKGDPARDTRMSAGLMPLLQNFQRTLTQQREFADERLDEFRWLLEELRVSLFAQELRTPQPVSTKRLQKIWESLRR
ncbi:MAG: ATP-dependent RNA helicase HrpA [Janthinobacterium lividum]